MTEKKGSDSDREVFAEAATRLILEDEEAQPSDSDASATTPATTPSATPSTTSSTTPATTSSEDDRTQLVTHADLGMREETPEELAETRVIADDSPPVVDVGAAAIAATRVLDPTEDKTSPPSVSERGAPAKPPPPTPIDSSRGLTTGMVLFGEYEIVNVLGVGGMGEVYRARHRRLDEFRAIKVMHADLSHKKGAIEFFYREAKALLAVRHPAVVHCHDLLSDEEGRVYLIMEMIEGIPLSQKMNDGPLSPDDVAILGARVSHGLSAAHRKGVIHRDVSPDNIVLPNGRVQEAKLIDFGIAKLLDDGEGTIIDGFKGKLSYASPEQLGFFGGKIDGRSDFYSLGLVLIAAAQGRPLSMGTTVMEAVDARRAFKALPEEIPMGLRSAIAPLLALNPDDRPKYVDRLFVVPGGMERGERSDDYVGLGGVSARAEKAGGMPQQAALFAGIVAAVLLAVGGGAYFALKRAPTPNELEQAARVAPPIADAAIAPNELAVPVARVVAEPAAVVAEVVAPIPEPAKPSKPKVRRLTASDRIKIIGLLNNAKMALAENQLMSPSNDNAYDRYRRVLALDSSNQKAKDGLRAVADRYLSLAKSSVAKDNLPEARTFLGRARKADSGHPGIAAVASRLAR